MDVLDLHCFRATMICRNCNGSISNVGFGEVIYEDLNNVVVKSMKSTNRPVKLFERMNVSKDIWLTYKLAHGLEIFNQNL